MPVFVPVGDDECRIDGNHLANLMIKYLKDIIYGGDGGYENKSLIQIL